MDNYSFGDFLFLLLVEVAHVDYLVGGLELFEFLELEGGAEFEQLLLLVVFSLGFDLVGGLGDLVCQFGQLLVQVLLLLLDVDLFLLELLYPIAEPTKGGLFEEDGVGKVLLHSEPAVDIDQILYL